MLIQLDNVETIGLAAVFLVIGHLIKERIPILERFFIPAPIIGGVLFSLIVLVGHQTGSFDLELSNDMRDLLLMLFFTTIGFTASLEMLKKGGIAVALFLLACTALVILQNAVGVSLASALGIHPLIGLATGSVSLTGGHGTSAAFGPLLEDKGAAGALPAAMAAATWGLVAGSMIGGPVGVRLLRKYNLKGPSKEELSHSEYTPQSTADLGSEPKEGDQPLTQATHAEVEAEITSTKEGRADNDGEQTLATAEAGFVDTGAAEGSAARAAQTLPVSLVSMILLCIAAGLGSVILTGLHKYGVTVPSYLAAMIVAAIIRNIIDWRGQRFPTVEMNTISMVSLSFFLVLALMSMRLWELADVFEPVLIILVVQTVVVFFFALLVTFRVMGKNYDAATLAVGHCGVGLGATPNAMANIQTFTNVNGPSPKAFFVIPIVGSLFIDFINAIVITIFINIIS